MSSATDTAAMSSQDRRGSRCARHEFGLGSGGHHVYLTRPVVAQKLSTAATALGDRPAPGRAGRRCGRRRGWSPASAVPRRLTPATGCAPGCADGTTAAVTASAASTAAGLRERGPRSVPTDVVDRGVVHRFDYTGTAIMSRACTIIRRRWPGRRGTRRRVVGDHVTWLHLVQRDRLTIPDCAWLGAEGRPACWNDHHQTGAVRRSGPRSPHVGSPGRVSAARTAVAPTPLPPPPSAGDRRGPSAAISLFRLASGVHRGWRQHRDGPSPTGPAASVTSAACCAAVSIAAAAP